MKDRSSPPGERRAYAAGVIDLLRYRTRRQLVGLTSERSWVSARAHPDWVPDHPLCLYVFDLETQAVAGGVINHDDLVGLQAMSRHLSDNDVRLILHEALVHYAATTGVYEPAVRDEAMIATALYAPRTETYRELAGSNAVHVNADCRDRPGLLKPAARIIRLGEGRHHPR